MILLPNCAGTSARYDVRLPDQTTSTRWDWKFTLNPCNRSSNPSDSTNKAATLPA